MTQRRQGIFWLLTIPQHEYVPYPNTNCSWIRGQLERGHDTGYLHWQLLVAFTAKKSLAQVRDIFGPYHAELGRSDAAAAYVWKDDTRVANTQFEFGAKPICRNRKHDWEEIWKHAVDGRMDSIPAGIRFQSYRTIRTIAADHAKPTAIVRDVVVYWGRTGTGKSRRAWDEAGFDAYCKDPRTKFWCGYSGQEHVIIDEFRGGIDIAHLLRWFDRYPVRVEIKGSSKPLVANRIWITSNLDPRRWYPEVDEETIEALMRRMAIEHFP